MATTIQIKRSSTASGVPLATDLAVGELAVNLADKRLFTKQSDGTIIELSTNPTDLDAATLRIDGVEITASATELNSLDGFTGSTTELNILDGLTATTIELNTLDGITASTAELNKLDGYTGSTAELNILDGVTATTAEINKLDGFTGVVADLNYAKDLRATGVTTTEFDKLDGLTATTTELNYVDGVTSNIQTQLDNKADDTTSPTLTLDGDVSGSATLTNLGDATLTVTVADDSHNHTIANVDGLQTALDGKATSAQGALADSAVQPNDDVSFGTVTADALTVDGQITIDNATNQKIHFENIGINPVISSNRALIVDIDTDGNQTGTSILFTSDNQSKNIASFSETGDIQFYEDTGTTAKMVWDASDEQLILGGGLAWSNNTTGLQLGFNDPDGYVTTYYDNTTVTLGAGVSQKTQVKVHGQSSTEGSAVTVQTGGSERMRIDSAGNVGIGSDSPSEKIEVAGNMLLNASNAELNLRSGVTGTTGSVNWTFNTSSINYASAKLSYDDRATTGLHIQSLYPITIDSTGQGTKFNILGSEKARIDNSGNLLVGTTDSVMYNNSAGTVADNGVRLSPSGFIDAASYNGIVGEFNRTGGDGTILNFRKDGATVGSIQSRAGLVTTLILDPRSTGAGITGGGTYIYPTNNTGSLTDGVCSLGIGGNRFKDLYLSGGVYLGGTGSANKLEDYEEGTWTPVAGAGNISGTSIVYSGEYVKVGKLVTAYFKAYTASDNLNVASYQVFSGLPFTVDKTGTGTVITEDIDLLDRQGFVSVGGTSLAISNSGSSSGTTTLWATVTYFTS